MNRSVRPAFKGLLEVDEICNKAVYQGLLNLGGELRRQGRHDPVCTSSGRCILAADPMRRGIHEGEVGGEGTVGDLIVVVGVTPAANAALPEIAILEVRCVFVKRINSVKGNNTSK